MIRVFKIVGCCCRILEGERKRYCSRNFCTRYSSLIIVKSLQLRGHSQIAEPRKYYIVRVIVLL